MHIAVLSSHNRGVILPQDPACTVRTTALYHCEEVSWVRLGLVCGCIFVRIHAKRGCLSEAALISVVVCTLNVTCMATMIATIVHGGTRAHREIAEIARGVLVGSRNSKAEKKIKLEEVVKLGQNKISRVSRGNKKKIGSHSSYTRPTFMELCCYVLAWKPSGTIEYFAFSAYDPSSLRPHWLSFTSRNNRDCFWRALLKLSARQRLYHSISNEKPPVSLNAEKLQNSEKHRQAFKRHLHLTRFGVLHPTNDFSKPESKVKRA